MNLYPFLSGLLSDKKGGAVFTCFGIWHLIYLAVIFGGIALTLFLLNDKSKDVKRRAADIAIKFAFGLYIADFFLMPFAYGEIDLEKLPFHACTAMCIMCFLSRRNSFLGKYKAQFALLGLVSNLIYVIYPAGVGWYAVHPISYRVIQTLLFHGTMSAYGIFSLAFDGAEPKWENWYKELFTVSAMTLWAFIGNTLYNGTYGEEMRFFNWFFVVRDPFYLLSENIAPYVMPFVMTAVMFAAEMIVYEVCFAMKRIRKK